MRGSIYMVFDYMDHDLTGLMERKSYKFSVPQVSLQLVLHAVHDSLIPSH